MDVEPGYALVEAVVIARLKTLGHDAGTSTPESLTATFHRVTRAGGDDDGTTDNALVDVETFSGRRHDAAQAAEDARQSLLALTGTTSAGALVDSVTTARAPGWVDYKNPSVQRYVATYRVQARRP
jgi:hypothetical protein